MQRYSRIAGALAVAALTLTACGHMGGGASPIPQAAPNATLTAPIGATGASHFSQTMPDGTVIHMMLPRTSVGMARMATASGGPVLYHGGVVMRAPVVYAIFWQPKGTYMSALYKPVIQEFLSKVGGTSQFNTLPQYHDTTGPVANAQKLGGAWTDTSPYPSNFSRSAAGDTDLHNEVLKAITANHWPVGGNNNLFAIFTAQNAPDDKWAACAYHGSFLKNTTNYIYTIVPYQHDYGAQGCGTPSTTWPNDRDADQTVDTLWHENAEAISDPITSGGAAAWYAADGSEIGDLCQTSYGPLAPNGSDTTLNGQQFVTQMIWSNSKNGCVQGQ